MYIHNIISIHITKTLNIARTTQASFKPLKTKNIPTLAIPKNAKRGGLLVQDILKKLYIRRFLGVKNLSTISTISTIRATVPF